MNEEDMIREEIKVAFEEFKRFCLQSRPTLHSRRLKLVSEEEFDMNTAPFPELIKQINIQFIEDLKKSTSYVALLKALDKVHSLHLKVTMDENNVDDTKFTELIEKYPKIIKNQQQEHMDYLGRLLNTYLIQSGFYSSILRNEEPSSSSDELTLHFKAHLEKNNQIVGILSIDGFKKLNRTIEIEDATIKKLGYSDLDNFLSLSKWEEVSSKHHNLRYEVWEYDWSRDIDMHSIAGLDFIIRKIPYYSEDISRTVGENPSEALENQIFGRIKSIIQLTFPWCVSFKVFAAKWSNPIYPEIAFKNVAFRGDLWEEEVLKYDPTLVDYRSDISKEDYEMLYKKVANIVSSVNQGKIAIAIRNFCQASLSDDEIAFLGYFIALEAVLLTKGPELAERFSRNLAMLVGKDIPSFGVARKLAKELYGLRSYWVHGDPKFELDKGLRNLANISESNDIYSIKQEIRNLVRYCILYFGTTAYLWKEDNSFKEELESQIGERLNSPIFEESIYKVLDFMLFNHEAIFWLRKKVKDYWGECWDYIKFEV